MQKMMESILKQESFFIQQQPILMGPLVDWSGLGEPDNLKRLLEQALERIALCSSDPFVLNMYPKKIVLFMLQHVLPVVSSLKLHVSGTIAISIAHYWFPPSKQVLNPFSNLDNYVWETFKILS